jgi:hypothetical protein
METQTYCIYGIGKLNNFGILNLMDTEYSWFFLHGYLLGGNHIQGGPKICFII